MLLVVASELPFTNACVCMRDQRTDLCVCRCSFRHCYPLRTFAQSSPSDSMAHPTVSACHVQFNPNTRVHQGEPLVYLLRRPGSHHDKRALPTQGALSEQSMA